MPCLSHEARLSPSSWLLKRVRKTLGMMKLTIEVDEGQLFNDSEICRIERDAQLDITQTGLGLTLLEAKAELAAAQKDTQSRQIVSCA